MIAPRAAVRRSRAPLLLALLAPLLLLGCGDDDEPTTLPQKSPTDDRLLVSYHRGGGIAGVDQLLEVDADGEARIEVAAIPMDADGDAPIATTGSEAEQRQFTLSESELATLNEALDAALPDFGALSNASPQTGCADCFIYTVAAAGRRIVLDDVSLDQAPESVQALITELGTIAHT